MHFMRFIIALASLYSTCARTVNWAQLKGIVASGNLTQLSRSPQAQGLYQQLKNKLKTQNTTMPDYVKQKIFGFKGHPKEPIHLIKMMLVNGTIIPVYVTGEQRIWGQFIKKTIYCTSRPGIKEGSKFFMFAINNFPYDLKLVNHWVIWSSCQLKQSSIKNLLGEIVGQNIETLTFQNSPEQKSIPEINHFQLFWKKKVDALHDL